MFRKSVLSAFLLACWVANASFAAEVQLHPTLDPYLTDTSTPIESSHITGPTSSSRRAAIISTFVMGNLAGLASNGVERGVLLFEGHRAGDRVTAYLFKKNCPAAAYDVFGHFDARYNLILAGDAPVWDRNSCALD